MRWSGAPEPFGAAVGRMWGFVCTSAEAEIYAPACSELERLVAAGAESLEASPASDV